MNKLINRKLIDRHQSNIVETSKFSTIKTQEKFSINISRRKEPWIESGKETAHHDRGHGQDPVPVPDLVVGTDIVIEEGAEDVQAKEKYDDREPQDDEARPKNRSGGPGIRKEKAWFENIRF